MELSAQPSGEVTVTVGHLGDGDMSADTDILATGAQNRLTFTTGNWSTAQTVWVTAAEDIDAADGTARFTHRASGGGFADAAGTVTVLEDDNDDGSRVVVVTPTEGSLQEGGTVTAAVRLGIIPTGQVAVDVDAGDLKLFDPLSDAVADSATLLFLPTDYATAQTLTFTAGEDDDSADQTTELTFTDSAGGYAAATVTATITDNDSDGILTSVSAIAVPENSIAAYDLRLATKPAADVTVTVQPGSAADTDLTVSATTPPLALTFTTDNWSAAQSVTLSAADDADAADGIAPIEHSATGYGSVVTVTASEGDDETQAVEFGQARLQVSEGGAATYRLRLKYKPAADVTVTIAVTESSNSQMSVDTVSATVGVQTEPLTFTTANWSDWRTVSVLAAEDDSNMVSGSARIHHAGSGIADGYVDITELENETGLRFSALPLTVGEGNSLTYGVALATRPSINSTLVVTRLATGSPDTDLAVTGGSTLTFTTSDWHSFKLVTLTASEDADFSNGTAVFAHRVSNPLENSAYSTVTVEMTASEIDNDSFQVVVAPRPLVMTEEAYHSYLISLASEPAADVDLTISGQHDGGGHLSSATNLELPLQPHHGLLRFTTDNYATGQQVSVFVTGDRDAQDNTGVLTFSNGTDAHLFTVAIVDDDVEDIGLTSSSLTVGEGGTVVYGVTLRTRPKSDAIVSVVSNQALVSLQPATLTFGTDNFSTAQSVTLTAGRDADGADRKVAVRHEVGGGYGPALRNLTVTVSDGDRKPALSTRSLTVDEGGTAIYSLRLAVRPTSEVTVTIWRAQGSDSDVMLAGSDFGTGGTRRTLTFSTTDYAVARSITLSAIEDSDTSGGEAILLHRAAGAGFSTVAESLAVTENDNDKGIDAAPALLAVSEGASTSYRLRLTQAPSQDVTVTASVAGSDYRFANGTETATVTFTPTDYATAQQLTLSARADLDGDADRVAVTHNASDSSYAGATVVVEEIDSDAKRFIFVPTSLTATEGTLAEYAVRLATKPSAAVLLTAIAAADRDGDAEIAVTSDPLVFSADNYAVLQTVTLTVRQDPDGESGQIRLAHTASGGGYGEVTGQLAVTAEDDDSKAISVAQAVTVGEGSEATLPVSLATRPFENVVVSMRPNGDADITVSPAALTFTPEGYETVQTATVAARDDADSADGTATISFVAAGGGYDAITGSLSVTESDSERDAIELSVSQLRMIEGDTARYGVRLNARPDANVTVTVARAEGSGVSVDSDGTADGLQNLITFLPDGYSDFQTVTVVATEDADSSDGSAQLSHSADGYASAAMLARVADDDVTGLVLSAASLAVSEGGSETVSLALSLEPSAEVIVSVASAGDDDIVVTPDKVTFSGSDFANLRTLTVSAMADEDGEAGTARLSLAASGGDYADITGQVAVTEIDDDAKGLTLTPTELNVAEGNTLTYSLRLDTMPLAPVTLSVGRSGDADVSTSLQQLTFTSETYGTDQTVTVTVAEDADGANGTATLTHAASGGGYDGLQARLTVTELDNDARGFTLQPTELSLTEDTTGSYQISMATQPLADTVVSISAREPSVAGVGSQDRITFTSANWSVAQTVTVTGLHDADAVLSQTVLEHGVEAGGYAGVTGLVSLTVTDTDSNGLSISADDLTVTEGGSATYILNLHAAPIGAATVRISRNESGDPDLAASPSELTFLAIDHPDRQTVTIAAAEDSDAETGVAQFTHSVTGGGYDGLSAATVTATEVEDETGGFVFSRPALQLSVSEGKSNSYGVHLESRPALPVTVSAVISGDESLTVQPAALTFTWNNFSIDQMFTVSAAADRDGDSGTAIIAHPLKGNGLNGRNAAAMAVAEIDDDSKGIQFLPANITVAEGATAVYGLRLETQPSAPVTVSVAVAATDAAISVRDTDPDTTGVQNTLVFTRVNYAAVQTVTVTAAADSGPVSGSAELTHTATGGGYADVVATVRASESDRNFVDLRFSSASVAVLEGSTAAYGVRLARRPLSAVTVTARSAIAGISLPTSILTFTTANYATFQSITLDAGHDVDGESRRTTVSHAVSTGGRTGLTGDNVAVTVADDDQKGFTFPNGQLTLTENGYASLYSVTLATRPTAPVTVTILSVGTGNQVVVDSDTRDGFQNTLTFQSDEYYLEQRVGLTPVADGDSSDGTAIVRFVASGGGYDGVSQTVEVTIVDESKAGTVFSEIDLQVGENGTASYEIHLDAEPAAAVTLAVAVSGDSDISVDTDAGTEGDQANLTFTTDNYATAQAVMVRAADDTDPLDGTADLTHTDIGSTPNRPAGVVTVREVDDDERGYLVTPRHRVVAEGSSGTFTVALATKPTGSVTATVSALSSRNASIDATTQDHGTVPHSLIFTPQNFATGRLLTIQANEDDADFIDGTASYRILSADSDYSGITTEVAFSETDNDAAEILVSATRLSVTEGGTGTYTVALALQPVEAITVTIAKGAGDDADLAVEDTDPLASGVQNTLIFSQQNYDTAQTVTVSATADTDEISGKATLTHTASGTTFANAVATVVVLEQDHGGFHVSASQLTIPEGGTATYLVQFNSGYQGTRKVVVNDGSGFAAVSGSTLIQSFEPTLDFHSWNYDTAQTLTLSAAEDDRDEDLSVDVTHSSGGTTFTLTAVNLDNDQMGIVASPAALSVDERGTATYGLALRSQPLAAVTVTASVRSGVGGVRIPDTAAVTAGKLTFTTDNWSTAQIVTVSAADDSNAADDSTIIEHVASEAHTGSRPPTNYGNAETLLMPVSVTDDDSTGLVLDRDAVSVGEGSSARYGLRLASQPSAAVTVAVQSGGDSDISASPAALTFSVRNFDHVQSVTLAAAADLDANDGLSTFTHTATGGGYDGVAATLTATEADDEVAALLASVPRLIVDEGSSAVYTVRLASEPQDSVTLSARISGSTSLWIAPRSLVFTSADWSTAQSLTVRASEESGNLSSAAMLLHSAAGGGYGGITLALPVQERDNEAGIFLSRQALTVSEGGSQAYAVVLTGAPAGAVTVTVAQQADGDADLSADPVQLTFTATDWSDSQSVTISARDDGDGVDGTAVFVHSQSGYGTVADVALTVTEADDETSTIALDPQSLSFLVGASPIEKSYDVSLAVRPTGKVTVSLALTQDAASLDSDFALSTSLLTFTTIDFSVPQTVTVTASAAASGVTNHAPGRARLTHSVTGASGSAGGYFGVSAVLDITENETSGLTVSPTTLAVSEGRAGTFTVSLGAQPSADVTVAASLTGDSDFARTPDALTFTTVNWASAQTMTVWAAEDADESDGTGRIGLVATGGGYDGSRAAISLSETDNDSSALLLSASGISVSEELKAAYGLSLATRPSGQVTVTVLRDSGDSDLAISGPSVLTFGIGNWDVAQSITLTAADDGDILDGVATFKHIAGGADYDDAGTLSITASESDNDSEGLVLSDVPTGFTLSEGSTAAYGLALASKPLSDVTVTVTADNGAYADLRLCVAASCSAASDFAAAGELTFTGENWSTAQRVQVRAHEDDDAEDGAGVIKHASASYAAEAGTVTVSASVTDVDEKALVLTAPPVLDVGEGGAATYEARLTARPTAAVTLSVIMEDGQDPSLRVKESSARIYFTTANWSDSQTITIFADEDSDGADGRTTVRHSVSPTGGYAGAAATVIELREIDNDVGKFVISHAALTISEGGTAYYTLRMGLAPTATATLTVARAAGGDADLIATPEFLTFSRDDYAVIRTITVRAAGDADGVDGSATFTHQAGTAGGYADLAFGSVTATEIDDDSAEINLSTMSLAVNEGGSAIYGVRLGAQPRDSVTVALAGSGDADLTLSPAALTFTAVNFSLRQSVTLSAAQDIDIVSGSAVITHSAAGLDPVVLAATEIDDDLRNVQLSTQALAIAEGSSAAYGVRLGYLPPGLATVTIIAAGDGDSDLTADKHYLTFSVENYETFQSITLSAADDADGDTGEADFAHAVGNGPATRLTATESENDEKAVLLDVPDTQYHNTNLVQGGDSKTYTVALSTQPSASVTVSLAIHRFLSYGDKDLNYSPAVLTFSTSNYADAQSVTISAPEDVDGLHGQIWLYHNPSGGGYGQVTAPAVTVASHDPDSVGMVLSTASLTIGEGESQVYDVRLAIPPTTNVTVSVARQTGSDSDLTISGAGKLTFTTDNWSAAQSITVTAADDDDPLDGSAEFIHKAQGAEYAGANYQTLTVTEADDDQRGLVLTTSVLTVPEGSSAAYGVELATQPTDSVTVAISRRTGTDADLSLSGSATASLTFTTANWNTAQSVAVTAAQDDDPLDGSAEFTHIASGADYGSAATVTVTASESDDDMRAIILATTELLVNEGSTAAYGLRLATKPTETVAVRIERSTTGTQDSDLSVVTESQPLILAFTTDNWNSLQSVTLSATEDADQAAGTAQILNYAAGADYGSVATVTLNATERDNDIPGLVIASTLTVPEGNTVTYGVRLAAAPTADAKVTVQKSSTGTQDGDLSLVGIDNALVNRVILTFSNTNWTVAQSVTLSAAEDDDAVDGVAQIHHQSSGGGYTVSADLAVTEADNDPAALTLSASSLNVSESGNTTNYETYTVKLATRPARSVSVTVQRSATGTQDSDISVKVTSSPLVLTFTTADWNSAQTVSLMAAADEDSLAGTAVIAHTASGSDEYSTVTAELTATEIDDETAALVVRPTTLSVAEAGTLTYLVSLLTEPTAQVTVTVTAETGSDPDLDVDSDGALAGQQSELTFTASNWSVGQTVTVSARNDVDDADGSAEFSHQASGGDYDEVAAITVTVTEADDDRAIRLSRANLTVPEGGVARYLVSLAGEPASALTVTVNSDRTEGDLAIIDTDSSLPGIQNILVFSSTDWSVGQTVTVSAAADADGDNGTQAFAHLSAAAGYAAVSATLTATEQDDDPKGLDLSESRLTITEGQTKILKVKLRTKPSANVTVSAATDVSFREKVQFEIRDGLTQNYEILTFSTSNYSSFQTLTATAIDDSDADDESGILIMFVSGGGYAVSPGLKVAVHDDEKAFLLPTAALVVSEGRTARYGISLSAAPSGKVTVTIGEQPGGDDDVTVTDLNPAIPGIQKTLTFTTANWSVRQSVTVTARQDTDTVHGIATLTHRAAGGGYGNIAGSLRVDERDDDSGFVFSPLPVTVAEGSQSTYGVRLNSQPSSTVVAVITAERDVDDRDIAFDPAVLTFQPGNYQTDRTVTVSVAEDADADDGVVVVHHLAVGGYGIGGGFYSNVGGGQLMISERDNDQRGYHFAALGSGATVAAIDVREGGSTAYAVRLATRPSTDITVTARIEPADVTAAVLGGARQPSTAPHIMTFTPDDYLDYQTVSVFGAEDTNAYQEVLHIRHSASGGLYENENWPERTDNLVKVTTQENDQQGYIFSPADLTVLEGTQGRYTVRLATDPGEPVTVTVSKVSLVQNAQPDADILLGDVDDARPGLQDRLTFTSANYHIPRTVLVSVKVDPDTVEQSVGLLHRGNGGADDAVQNLDATFRVTEDETTAAAVLLSATELELSEEDSGSYGVKLSAKPADGVTVTVNQAKSGDDSISINDLDDVAAGVQTSLEFTASNWSDYQSVTVTAAEDDDGDSGTAVIDVTATGHLSAKSRSPKSTRMTRGSVSRMAA